LGLDGASNYARKCASHNKFQKKGSVESDYCDNYDNGFLNKFQKKLKNGKKIDSDLNFK
jgi:hypothetical protein